MARYAGPSRSDIPFLIAGRRRQVDRRRPWADRRRRRAGIAIRTGSRIVRMAREYVFEIQ